MYSWILIKRNNIGENDASVDRVNNINCIFYERGTGNIVRDDWQSSHPSAHGENIESSFPDI